MKKNYIFKLSLVSIPLLAFVLMSQSGGMTSAVSGSPGDGGNSCTNCHSGGNFNASAVITTNIPVAGYELNKDYTISINTSSSSSTLGFQLVAENDSNTKIGVFTPGSGTRVSSTGAGNRITQSTPSVTGNWSFTWRSPSTNQGKVTFYSAINATNGNGNTSGDQVVTTSTSANVLGISEAKRLDFDMFPNPATDNVTIQLGQDTNNATVQFYDYIGRLALTKNISASNQQIDVKSLTSGIYILKIVAEGKVGTQKFIKN